MRIKLKKSLSKKQTKNLVRRARVRKKVIGTAQRPRLSVYFALRSIYAQVINDEAGVTMASVHMKSNKVNKEMAKQVGTELAKKAKQAKVEEVVFDRGFKSYSGRNQALAAAAREVGLRF